MSAGAAVRLLGIMVAAATVLLLACDDVPPPPAGGVAKTKAAKQEQAPAPSPASSAAALAYSYTPIGKRDPFRGRTMVEAAASQSEAEMQICDEPLCQFDLNDLSLVAVVSGDANPLGMVEDRGGIGHVVRRNSKIGRNGGKVTQIIRDCIVVTSYISGPDGKAQPNKTNMCVKSDTRTAPVLDLLSGKPFQ